MIGRNFIKIIFFGMLLVSSLLKASNNKSSGVNAHTKQASDLSQFANHYVKK